MDNKQKDAPTKDLSPEQQEQYDMLMFEGKQLHPKTSTYILDLAIRFYLVHGDNMLNVKSLSEENLQKMKDKYETNAEEFFGSVEVVRKEDLTEEQIKKYDDDRKQVEEQLESKDYTDELVQKMQKVAVLENIESQ